MSKSQSFKLVTCGWCVSIAFAILHLMEQVLKHKDMPNSLCFTLIDINIGNDIVLTILYIYNFLLISLTIVLNIGILRVVITNYFSATELRRNRSSSRSVAIRIIAVVLTNIISWLILAICTTATHTLNIKLPLTTQAWIVVLAVPINGIINPILNIFTTHQFYVCKGKRCKT